MDRLRRRWLLLVCALALGACDRAMEPFDPDEQVEAPELGKIFPPGAERAPGDAPAMGGGAPAGPPPAPGARSGARSGAQSGAQSGAGSGPRSEALSGRVTLAPDLADSVPAGAVLFVIARVGEGGPPLAVKRIQDPSFPQSFRIGPEDRMMEGSPWGGPFQLSARVDADGNATSRTPGDLAGSTREPVGAGTRGIEILVDQTL